MAILSYPKMTSHSEVIFGYVFLYTCVTLIINNPSLITAAQEPTTMSSTMFNYEDALSMSLLFFEAQRSGKISPNQRVPWRGDSALNDGDDVNVDLTGGYYDAGDNVKFGFPMAFTLSVLAWGALENVAGFEKSGELSNVESAIRWGTDYLLKASSNMPSQLWVQVGDGDSDHQCWERPETMTTLRTSYQINESYPGTEVAAETAAALAAASLVFRLLDSDYSELLLERAYNVFEFADRNQASNTGECPFYCSYNGYNDELVWAAAWLLKASDAGAGAAYLQYVEEALSKSMLANTVEFSWDSKGAGAAVLLAGLRSGWTEVEAIAEYFMCANLQGNSLTQVHKTAGGLLYFGEWANTQYAGGAAFLAGMYASYLSRKGEGASITCSEAQYGRQDLTELAKSQVDYLLGNNPMGMSYMVGFGSSTWPTRVHHRGASIPANYTSAESCGEGYELWFDSDAPNPNEIVGAIVGGPDRTDAFLDQRSNAAQLEPTTYINAVWTGTLTYLLALS